MFSLFDISCYLILLKVHYVIKKQLFRAVSIFIIAISLSACGNKGIDRKLDYTGTEKELGESYGKAMAEAPPEEQNILRDRADGIISTVLTLIKNSNPALVDAFVAKKNAEEFERVRQMSVRELFAWLYGERQKSLNNAVHVLESFQSGNVLKIEGVTIDDVNPKDLTPSTSSISVDGVINIRNDSDGFDYDSRGLQLAMIINGKQIGGVDEVHDLKEYKIIKSNGGKGSFKYKYSISGEENIKTFYDFLKSGQINKIVFVFKPSNSSYITSSTNKNMVFSAGDDQLKEIKADLQKITADLAVMKK